MTGLAVAAAATAIVCCCALALLTGTVVKRLQPAQAVVLLTTVALALSLACGVSLTAIAIAVLATVRSVAADGHWSATVVRANVVLPAWLGPVAAVAVLLLLLRTGWRVGRISLALVRTERLGRAIRANGGPVIIVDDDTADAYTLAGIRGCVVISRRLLEPLTPEERRVVTAHELAHLTRRHHLYVHLADIAAAANPLLRGVPRAIRIGVERWADEEAAAGIGNRRVTGRAIARVALVRAAINRSVGMTAAAGAVLGVAEYAVAARVQALFQPARRGRPGLVITAVAMAALVLLVGTVSLDHIQDIIEAAAR